MKSISRSAQYLGTSFEIKLPQDFFSLCFSELERIEKKYSRFLDDSALSTLNNSLNKWVEVDEEFLFLIKKALKFHASTEGNFDITLKETLDSLGYDKRYSFEKKESKDEQIDNPIQIKEKRVFLKKQIDFGGFGKGFALDRLSDLLDEKGVEQYYLNAGGDIKTKGAWTILLEHPHKTEYTIGKVELQGALASSSPNRRKWKDAHHLINAKTKTPQEDMAQIFVRAQSGLAADAYATALFSAGFLKAIELSKRLGVKVLIISAQDKMYRSDGFDVEFFT